MHHQAVKIKADAVALLYTDDGDFPTWCATMNLPHAWFDFVPPAAPFDAMQQAAEAAASMAYLVVSANAAAA
jgi:hypothetical protein